MKKQLLLLVLMMLPLVARADTWDGVRSDKSWYDENASDLYINNAAQLKGLADLVNNDGIFFEGKTVYLQNDIDLANKNWVPIGFGYKVSFKGSFDGKNHIVSNMYCPTNQFEHGAITRFGFFGESSGSISNLEIQGTISINGGYLSSPCIGGVVGYGNDITNVRSKIIINTWASLGTTYIGNVAGWAHNMTKIYSEGEVHFYDSARFSNQSYYGGIAGHGWEFSECFSNVRVVIPSDGSPMFSGGSVGGIAGEASSISDAIFTGRFEVYENNKNRTTLSGCISGITVHLSNIVCAPSYYYCNTEKNIYFKGLVVPGIDKPTVNNVYYQDTYAQGTSVIGTGVSEDFLKSGETLAGFSSSVWKFKKGEYPILKAFDDSDDEVDASGRINGVYYELDTQSKTAKVVSGSIKYSGDVVIKEFIKSGGEKYVVNAIEASAFYNCANLNSVFIPNSVASIGDNAFYECDALTAINLPSSINKINDCLFFACISLESITVPATVTSIGDYAFRNCWKLQEIIIPNGVKSIGYNAFNDCIRLKTISIPESIEDVGQGAFDGTPWLESQPDGLIYIGKVAYIYKGTMPNNHSVVLKSGTTQILGQCFSGQKELVSIHLPESVKDIEGSAFYGCTNLANVNIPSSIKEIKSSTFQGCTSLESIVLPESLECIGQFAFASSGLLSIDFPNSLKKIEIGAFNRSKIESVYIPASVSSWENSYYGCNIKSIIVNEGNSFYDSRNNCNAVIETATNTMIYGCQNSFIPEGIVKIADYTFNDCANLHSIFIPNTVKIIGNQAFKGCTGLNSVIIENGVTSINSSAFYGCSNLQSIFLPQSITTIGHVAFYGCDNLVTVTAKMGTPLSITKETFSNRSNATLYVLNRCKEKYASATYWNEFKEIKTIKHKLTYIVDSELYDDFDVDEGETVTPEPEPTKEGHTFSGWSEIPKRMPDHDVEVTGTFTINKYKLTYMIDGVKYKSYDVEYGQAITPETEPTKEGYTFSGWSYIPKKMPAEDVTVTGKFTANYYKLTYMVGCKV